MVTWWIGQQLVLAMLFGMLWLSGRPGPVARWADYGAVYPLLIMLFLVLGRASSLLYEGELNPDESQVIAQALTLMRYPVYWASVDGNTIGPVQSYYLALVGLLGGGLTYSTTRLALLPLLLLTIWLTYRTLLRITSVPAARLSLLLLVLFLAQTILPDFLHFSSEWPALLLNALLLYYAVAWAGQGDRVPAGQWVLLGAAAGLVPYAKLQAVPLTAVIGCVLVGQLLRNGKPAALRRIGWLVVGGILPTALVVGFCTYQGLLSDFYRFYVLANLNYGEIYAGHPEQASGLLAALRGRVMPQRDFLLAAAAPMGLLFVLLGIRCIRLRIKPGGPWLLPLLVLLLTAVYVVWKPGTFFGHHFLFILFSATLVLGVLLNAVSTASLTYRRLLPGLLFGTYAGLLLYGVARYLTGGPEKLNPYLWHVLADQPRSPLAPVVSLIHRYRQADDRIAVWGWDGRYYVEAQSAQATRDNHIQRCVVASSLQADYVKRYVADLIANRPALLIDSSPQMPLGLHTLPVRPETFTAVGRILRRNYTLIRTVNRVRVFVRNDRINVRVSP